MTESNCKRCLAGVCSEHRPEPEMFTTEWRAERVRQGDAYLNLATDPTKSLSLASETVANLIAVAQAHYQAANIRSRPGESARKSQDPTKTYVDRFGNLWKNGEVIDSSTPEEKP